MATDPWGIEDGYWDIAGAWHDTPPDTRRALRLAMGGLGDVEDPPPASRPVWFVRHGTAPSIQRPAELVLEDGTEVRATDALPENLPLGYHDLHPEDGGPTTRLIVAPLRCHQPDGLRSWGWSVQLYAARSHASWGIGDLADLRTLAEWSSALGADYLLLNPLHAARPTPVQEPSPYYPSSRRFRNPLYLRIDEVPGYSDANSALTSPANAARALNEDRQIDRDRVFTLKLEALDELWREFDGSARFDAFVAEHGEALRLYATYCALAEHHRHGWTKWPSEHRRPESPGVVRFALANEDRLRFHMWLQWLLDEQLARAGDAIRLLGDLAVGVDPDGADGWVWQDVLARGVRVGAPPDSFNTEGQDWGLPPFVPWKLRALGYEPFAQTVRAALRHSGALRIDHVMGLFRLFWIPEGSTPEDGTYVRFPADELLDIVALESVRAEAVIVGEDLGTVEDEVRDTLAERNVLSYRLLWFEPRPPEEFPEQALAAVTTHDLPTVAGVWQDQDPDSEQAAQLRERLIELTGLDADADTAEVVAATYRRLADAPSLILAAALDDALCVEERPNLPGTTTEWPNWSLALPKPVEEIVADPRVAAVADAVRSRRTGRD
jgi:4-alpha-glucanotransferase